MSEALPFFEGEYQLWWQLARGLGFQLGAWIFFFSSLKSCGAPCETEAMNPVGVNTFCRSQVLPLIVPMSWSSWWRTGPGFTGICAPDGLPPTFWTPELDRAARARCARKAKRKVGFSRFHGRSESKNPSFRSLDMWCLVMLEARAAAFCWNSGGSTFNRVFSLCSSSYNSYNSRSVKARTAWRVRWLGRSCRSGFQAAWGLNGVGWHGVAPCKGDSFIALGPLISGTCNFFESPKFPWA